MQVTVELPDDVAQALENGQPGTVPRRVVETIALEGYRSGELTHAQVRRLLGFEHRLQVDAFLKEHGVSLHYTLEDLERDRETLRRLGV